MRLRPSPATPSRVAAVLLLATLAGVPAAAHAQGGFLDRMAKRAQDNLERKAEEALKGGAKRDSGTARPAAGGAPVAGVEGGDGVAGGTPMAGPVAAAATPAAAGFRRERVPLLALDYGRTMVGEVPRGVGVQDGNVSVGLVGERRWIRLAATRNEIQLELPRPLPDRFTFETELAHSTRSLNHITITFGTARGVSSSRHAGKLTFRLESDGRVEVSGEGASDANGKTTVLWGRGRALPVRVMSDARYLRVWAGNERVLNLPRAHVDGGNAIDVFAYASEDSPAFIGPVRVMVAPPSISETLGMGEPATVTTLRFARGSAALPDDAEDTLQEMVAALREHPTLKLRVETWAREGATPAADAELSQRRARAIVRALVETYGAPAARLVARGNGRGDLAEDDGNDPPPQRLTIVGG